MLISLRPGKLPFVEYSVDLCMHFLRGSAG